MSTDHAGELKLFEEKKRSGDGDHTSGSVQGGDNVPPWVSEDSEDERMELGGDAGGSENGETEGTQVKSKGRHKEEGKYLHTKVPCFQV